MSLDAFFVQSGTTKKKEKGKRGVKVKASSNDTVANTQEDDGEVDPEDVGLLSGQSDESDSVVDRVTANISKMLDDKLSPLNELSEKFDAVMERMDTVEQRVSDLEDAATTSEQRISSLEAQLGKAVERLEAFENQDRRQNVRIVGLKEGIEGASPVEFFQKWIPEILGLQRDLVIDKARHSGPFGAQGPRTVLVRLHYYTDAQRILQAARAKGTINITTGKVSFYQDFTAAVAKRRQESANARRALRDAGIKYSFLFPATIKIFNPDGSSLFLKTAEEAKDYVKKLPRAKEGQA
ncbi:hypothetical protein WMY93_002415 [Mugilogobius chulae]|uniref:L1 transposable element RRM domain-containing protein n=1 Tax=Mugilogobius chulae TaxID=88201 RepID=A0AAW0Q4N3_9GOBI